MTIQQLVQEIFQQLINLIGELAVIILPTVGALAITWVKQTFENIRKNQPEYLQRVLNTFAEVVIRSVQQEFENGTLAREELIDEALSRFDSLMKQVGYNIDLTVLRTVLEGLMLPTKTKIAEDKQARIVSRQTPKPVESNQNVDVTNSDVIILKDSKP